MITSHQFRTMSDKDECEYAWHQTPCGRPGAHHQTMDRAHRTQLFSMSYDDAGNTTVAYGHATPNVMDQYWRSYAMDYSSVIIRRVYRVRHNYTDGVNNWPVPDVIK